MNVEQCIFDRVIWTIHTSRLVQTKCCTFETTTSAIDKSMKSLPHCEHEKQKQKIPLEEQKESSRRLQRLVNESLAFHLLEILYPVIMMSQEKKRKEKWKHWDFTGCQRSCPHAMYMVCCTAQHLGEIWESAHLCDICDPSRCKSHSGKTTASLSPSHLVKRNLHGYGRKPNRRRFYA